MRVVIDTNILISALLTTQSKPSKLLHLWTAHRFDLITCEAQIQELRLTTQKPILRNLIPGPTVGKLINQVRDLAFCVENYEIEKVCRDYSDDYLLALSKAVKADYLVGGDKDLFTLKKYGGCRMVKVEYLWRRLM